MKKNGDSVLENDFWEETEYVTASFAQYQEHLLLEKGTPILLMFIYKISLRLAFTYICRCISFLLKWNY